MDQTAKNYLTTRVMSASPQELRLLLLNAAVKHAQQACDGLATKNYELSYNGFTQSRAIVLELISGISPDAGPDLAENVRNVYLFIFRELMDASFEKSVERTRKIVELLEYERDTWILAMEHIANEKRAATTPGRQAGSSNPNTPSKPTAPVGKTHPGPVSDAPAPRLPLSIQA